MRLQQSRLQMILELGRQGVHLLFRPEQIKRAFVESTQGPGGPEREHQEQLLRGLNLVTLLPTTCEQIEFLEALPDHVQGKVCRFYFQLISEGSVDRPVLN
jgi:hypothetical protein